MGATRAILNESQAIEITGKIMVLVVILLFTVAVFVLLLHLYTSCFVRRLVVQETAPSPRVLRRRRHRRFVFAPGSDIFETIYGTNHNVVVGLDPSVLKSLQVLVFKPEEFQDGLECSVCLSEIVEGEKLRLLPNCNHGFHVDCIDMWFQSHSTCPLCRTLVTSSYSTSSSDEENNDKSNSELSSSQEENLGDVSGIESSNFPTHVLVFGDQEQFGSIGVSLVEEEGETCEEPHSSFSSSSPANDSRSIDGMLVIDVPSEINSSSSSLSPSARACDEDEVKPPMVATRLRSLKRILSRDKKLSPCSSNSIDVEQAQS